MAENRVSQVVQEVLVQRSELTNFRSSQVVQEVLLKDTNPTTFRASQSITQVLRSQENYAPTSIVGSLVRMMTDITADYSAGVRVAWDMKSYDTGNFWSKAQPTRLTIPTEYDNYWGFIACNLYVYNISGTMEHSLEIWKNGNNNAYDGMAGSLQNTGSGIGSNPTTGLLQAKTQFIQFKKNDYYQSSYDTSVNDLSCTISAGASSFCIYVLGQNVEGCLLRKAANATAQNYTSFPMMTWDAEIIDTGGFHSNTVNPSRITITAAAAGRWAIFKANTRVSSVSISSNASIGILKNNAFSTPGLSGQRVQNANTGVEHWVEVESAPVLLVENDYYEVQFQTDDPSVTFLADKSTFGFIILPSPEITVAKKAADQTLVNASAGDGINVTWDGTDIIDTYNVHNPASSNDYFIIPPELAGRFGIFHSHIDAPLLTTQTASFTLKIQREDTDFYDGFGGFSGHHGTYTTGERSVSSQIVELIPGNRWKTRLYSADNSITISAMSHMSLWVLPLAQEYLSFAALANASGKPEPPGQDKKNEAKKYHMFYIRKKRIERTNFSGRYSGASIQFVYDPVVPPKVYTPPDLTHGKRTIRKPPRILTRS